MIQGQQQTCHQQQQHPLRQGTVVPLLAHQIQVIGSTSTNARQSPSTSIHLLPSNKPQHHLPPPCQQQQCPVHQRSLPHRQHSRNKNLTTTSWSATYPNKSSISPPTSQFSSDLSLVWASAIRTPSRCDPVYMQFWMGPRS